MIYTIGHTLNYIRAILESGEILKIGKRPPGDPISEGYPDGYPGGYAFETYEIADQTRIELGHESDWSVFGLDTTWDNTYPSGDLRYHYLLTDATILVLDDGRMIDIEFPVELWKEEYVNAMCGALGVPQKLLRSKNK